MNKKEMKYIQEMIDGNETLARAIKHVIANKISTERFLLMNALITQLYASIWSVFSTSVSDIDHYAPARINTDELLNNFYEFTDEHFNEEKDGRKARTN